MKAGLVYPIGPNSASAWSGNTTSSGPTPQDTTKVAMKKVRRVRRLIGFTLRTWGVVTTMDKTPSRAAASPAEQPIAIETGRGLRPRQCSLAARCQAGPPLGLLPLAGEKVIVSIHEEADRLSNQPEPVVVQHYGDPIDS